MIRESFQFIPRELASMSRTISSGISTLVSGSLGVLLLVWRRFFLGDLAYPSVTYDERGSNCFGGTDLFHLGDYSTCLLFPLYNYREGLDGISIDPKVPNCLMCSPNLSQGLLRNCEQRPGKSAPFPIFSSSHGGEGLDEMFTLSMMVFLF